MTIPVTITFTLDDMAQAEKAIAAVCQILSPAPERKATGSASQMTGSEGANAGEGHVNGVASAIPSGQESVGAQPAGLDAVIDPKRTTSGPDVKWAFDIKMDGGVTVAVEGQARPASVVDAESSPSSIASPERRVRPHCAWPEKCRCFGPTHCAACFYLSGYTAA